MPRRRWRESGRERGQEPTDEHHQRRGRQRQREGDAAAQAIAWTTTELPPSATPPTLRWRDAGAPAGTRYALYASDDHGRVWLAAFEWSGGALGLTGDEAAMPNAAFALLPKDRDVLLTLRRAPVAADDDPTRLPTSPPLRFRRL